MSDTLYNYHDSDFNLDDAGSYTLLLMAAADHFSLAILKSGKLMAWLRERPVEALLNPDDDLNNLLTASYAQVVAGIVPQKFTLWPNAVLEQTQIPAIARLLNVEETESIFIDQLDQENTVIFAAPQVIAECINKYGFENQAVFGPKGWIKALVADTASNFYIHVYRNKVEVLYVKDGKVRLYNSFRYSNAEELAYYTLLAAQELELDLKVTTVKATGDVQTGDAVMRRLSEFFKSTEVLDLMVIDLPSSVPAGSILALSALNLCASLAEA